MTEVPDSPTVPGYTTRRLMDRGAMGSLWEAVDRRGRRVALKVADRGRRVSPELLRRQYRREAAAVLHLRHDNLVHGYEVGETEDGRPFLALEYLEGESLTRRMRRGALAEDEAIAIGIGVAKALEHMHAHRLIHRDLKPDNVMLLPDGRVKLVDLGLAEELWQDAPGCGSPGYASPEMIRRRKVGPASDLFALGVMLATAVLGRLAFSGATVKEVLRKTLRERLVLPEQVGDRVLSEDFRRIVQRLAEKAPRRRYGSAAEARLDLEALRDGDRPFGLWLARPRRWFGRRRVVAVAAAALGVLGGTALLWPGRDDQPPPEPAPPVATRVPAPEIEEPDLELEAALLFAERNPDATQEARDLIDAVRARAVRPGQRRRLEAAERLLTEHFHRRARAALEARLETARKHRATGDLESMVRALGEWPADLAEAPECRQARELAASWKEEALAPGRRLIARVEVTLATWGTGTPPSPEAVETLHARVDALRKDHALPRSQRPVLARLVGRVAAWRAAAAAQARERRALDVLGRALRAAGPERATALRELATGAGTRGTEAARRAQDVLALAAGLETRLAQALRTARGKPWAGVLGRDLHVGALSDALRPVDAFAVGLRVWDPEKPWRRDEDDLRAHARGAAEMDAWLWLRGDRIDVAAAEQADDPLRRLWALTEIEPPAPAAEQPLGGFWPALRERLSLALRPVGRPAVLGAEATDPVLRAWLAATSNSAARRPSGRDDEYLAAARAAFLADDPLRAWAALESTVRAAPWNGEAALLAGMVLEVLAEPLPQRATLLLALTEARRAWDLDPSLTEAPRHVARLALRLGRAAPSDLRTRLEPVTAGACRAVVRQGREEPAMIVFLAEGHERSGEHREALRMLRRANERWSSDAGILLALGRLEAGHGDAARALSALEEARAHLGADFPAWAEALRQRLRH